jgi:peptidoglycan/LPS O-acetylase OafA/YrhL
MSQFSPQFRIPELDGLRGIAILMVLAYHFLDLFPINVPNPLPHLVAHSLGLGWTGVDLFFVLSGFLIGGILLDARESPNYFKTFYARRFFRIIPIYYAWIVLYAVVVLVILRGGPPSFDDVREHWISVPIHFLFLQNVVRIRHSLLGLAWLGHLWTLAIEEQFYLAIPLAIRFLRRPHLLMLLGSAIAGAPVLRFAVTQIAPHNLAAPYLLVPCRADALALGVLLAILWRSDRVKKLLLRWRALLYVPIVLLSIPVLYLAVSNPSPYNRSIATWGLSAIDFAFVFLLALVLTNPRGIPAAICRSALLRGTGQLSYCIYIIHPALNYLFAGLLLPGAVHNEPWRYAVAATAATVATFGIARISWIFFERPLLRMGHSFEY